MRIFCHTQKLVMSTLVLICFSNFANSANLELNYQNPTYGTQHAYVNVGKGNLTFATTDLTVVNRIPLEVKRVYDSSLISANSAFGRGWHLNFAETITIQSPNKLIYLDENANQLVLTKSKTAQLVTQLTVKNQHLSQITQATMTNNTIELQFNNGWQKTFHLFEDSYKLTTISDNNNNTLNLSYINNKLSQVTASNRLKLTFYYQNSGLIDRVQSSTGKVIKYDFDQQQLSRVNGHRWHYQYNNQLLSKVTHQSGIKHHFSYNQQKQIDKINLNQQNYQFKYLDNQTTVTFNQGHSFLYQQHSSGITELASHRDQQQRLILNPQLKIKAVQHNGNTIAKYHYNDHDNISKIEHFSRQQLGYTLGYVLDYVLSLDRSGRVIYIENKQPNSLPSAYLYDGSGNLVSIRDKSGYAHFGYNLYGDLISLTKNNRTITFDHDIKGQINRANTHINGKTITAKYQYDIDGNLIASQYSDLIAERVFSVAMQSNPKTTINPIASAQYQLSPQTQIIKIANNHRLHSNFARNSTEIAWRNH